MKKICIFLLALGCLPFAHAQNVVPAAWTYSSNTGNNASVGIPSAINLTILTRKIQTDDAIGVFFTRNDSLICAGYDKWVEGKNFAVTAWGDNDQTSVKEGLVAGEKLTFKVWDAKAGKEYLCDAAFATGTGAYSRDGIFVLSSIVPAILSVAPTMYRADSVAVGDSSIQSLVMRNASGSDLPFALQGAKTNNFSLRGALAGKVRAHDSAVVVIAYRPAAFGDHRDTVSVTSPGFDVTYPLAGSSPSPAMKMSIPSITYGSVKKDSSLKRTIVVWNTSINRLRIDSLKTRSRQFTVDTYTLPVFVGRRDSVTIAVTFKPDTVRLYEDTLRIYSNAQPAIVTSPLTGNGKLTAAGQQENYSPAAFTLGQNFPNPFNPSTSMSYRLPVLSRVTLRIHNVLGQVIAVLVDRDQAAGEYHVQWNAEAAGGIYFCTLVAVSRSEPGRRFTEVKKMLLR